MNVYYDPINGWSTNQPQRLLSENRDMTDTVYVVKNMNNEVIGVRSSYSGAYAVAESIHDHVLIESWQLDGVKKNTITI